MIDAVRAARAVLHLAAQVAVTDSVTDPCADFEINARGTFNVLEAVRLHNRSAPCPVRLHEQSLWAPDRRHPDRAPRQALRSDQPGDGGRHIGKRTARFLQPLWLLEGHRRPVCSRLRARIRAADRGHAHELHLRTPAVRHRGSGLDRAFSAERNPRQAANDLRRRRVRFATRCTSPTRSPPGWRPSITSRWCEDGCSTSAAASPIRSACSN